MKSSGLAANVKVVDGAVVDHNSVVSMNQETKGKKHKNTSCEASNEEYEYLSEYEQVEEDLSEDAQDGGNRSKGKEYGVHPINGDSSIEVVEEEYVEEEYTEGEEYSDVEYIEEVVEEESLDKVVSKKEMTSKKSGEERFVVPVSGVIQSNSCEKKRKTDMEMVNAHTKYKVQEMPSKTKPELDSKERKVSSSGMKRKSRWDSQSKDHSSFDGNENKPNKKKSRWDRVEDQEKNMSPSSLDDYGDFLKLKQQLIEIDLKLQRVEGSQGNEAKNICEKLQKERAKIAKICLSRRIVNL